ncbi:MAG: tetratricopeptide repeat protein [Planctomycetes bacterium]|nr:tetratricopeptide repeat protein [Planctomycetota bacterium]
MEPAEWNISRVPTSTGPRAVVILLLVVGAAVPSWAVSHLKLYDKAPPFHLPALLPPGKRVGLEPRDRPILLVFGEPYHQGTLEALTTLKKVYRTVGLAEIDVPVYLILSQEPTAQQKAQLDAQERIPADILLDKDCRAFGDYGVIVLPSVVVIDKEGKVNLALSGLPLAFSDMVEDALLFSTGRMTRAEYESSRSAPKSAQDQEKAARVSRLTGLAGQLLRRDFGELALERYQEALGLDGGYLPARVGMARCYLQLNRLPEACEQLQKVLEVEKDHLEANLLMAWVEIRRGGEEIAAAQWRLNWILTTHPSHPQANYLMGLVYEARGEKDRALEHYKKAAQLLVEMDGH